MKSQEIFLFFFIFLPLFLWKTPEAVWSTASGVFPRSGLRCRAAAAVCIHYIRINIHSVFIQKWIILLNIRLFNEKIHCFVKNIWLTGRKSHWYCMFIQLTMNNMQSIMQLSKTTPRGNKRRREIWKNCSAYCWHWPCWPALPAAVRPPRPTT